MLYPTKLSFRLEVQIKSFPGKKKLKEFIINKLLLYEMFKDLFKKRRSNINNRMAINTYLSTIESNKRTKQTRRTVTESWIPRGF